MRSPRFLCISLCNLTSYFSVFCVHIVLKESRRLVYCLFNDAVSSSRYTVTNSGLVINELQKIWKEAVMVWFEVLFQYCCRQTKKRLEESATTTRFRAEIWTQDRPKTKQERHSLDCGVIYSFRCRPSNDNICGFSVCLTDGTTPLFHMSTSKQYLCLQNRQLSKYSDWLRAGRPRGRSSSPGRVKNFLFSTSSKPALESTQPRVQWVQEAISPGVKRPGREDDHSPPTSAGSRRRGSIDALNRVQRKAAEFANNADQTGWEALADRRRVSRLCALFKAYTGRRAWKAIGGRLLRPCYLSREDHNRRIRSRKQRTDIVKYSFVNRTIINWNQLPADILASLPLS
jgi:hypothetical protein